MRYAKGFSLAEAMMAAVILGFAAAGLVIPFSSGASARAQGDRQTLAAALASDLLEQISVTSYSQIITTWGSYSETAGRVVMDFDSGDYFTDPAYAPFSRTATCTRVYMAQQDGTATPNFITATVTVSFNGVEMVSITKLISE